MFRGKNTTLGLLVMVVAGLGCVSLKGMESWARTFPAGVISDEELQCRNACQSLFASKVTELNQKRMKEIQALDEQKEKLSMSQDNYDANRWRIEQKYRPQYHQLEQELGQCMRKCLDDYRWHR
ncbi:hypothetical protein KJZ61_00340 [Candidatus Dependentiae bacterium]|nr:hypothetical protein [Candidatus Dependentiae bacterium]